MKYRIKILLCCMLISQLFLTTVYAAPDWPSDMGIQAEAGIVMDADSGTVLFGQNIYAAYPPASITKILTALIVLENSNLDDIVTFSKDAVYNVEPGSGNKLNVTEGDKLSVEDCLYSLILHSCNQAANALAEHVAGSREEFVRMMNDKIAEIGCTESHFDNPSGLNGDTQYVTAYDMALIARVAYNNKKLVEISSAVSHHIAPTANNPDGLTIRIEHKLLKTTDSSSEYYYPQAVAGKTGWLSKAGNTLVTYAEQDGRKLISVVLKGKPGQYYIDGKTMLEFGFSRFENLSVTENESSYTSGENPVEIGGKSYKPSDLKLQSNCVITLPKGSEFSQVDKTLVTELPSGSPDEAVALVQYAYNERKVGQAYLFTRAVTEQSGQESDEGTTASETASNKPESDSPKTDKGGKNRSGMFVLIGIVALAGLTGIGAFVYRNKKEAREISLRREERRRRLKAEGDAEAFEQILRERQSKKKK